MDCTYSHGDSQSRLSGPVLDTDTGIFPFQHFCIYSTLLLQQSVHVPFLQLVSPSSLPTLHLIFNIFDTLHQISRLWASPDICLEAQIMFGDVHAHLPKAAEWCINLPLEAPQRQPDKLGSVLHYMELKSWSVERDSGLRNLSELLL